MLDHESYPERSTSVAGPHLVVSIQVGEVMDLSLDPDSELYTTQLLAHSSARPDYCSLGHCLAPSTPPRAYYALIFKTRGKLY